MSVKRDKHKEGRHFTGIRRLSSVAVFSSASTVRVFVGGKRAILAAEMCDRRLRRGMRLMSERMGKDIRKCRLKSFRIRCGG